MARVSTWMGKHRVAALVVYCAGAVVAAGALLALDAAVDLGVDTAVAATAARDFLAAVVGTMVTATAVVFWIRGYILSSQAERFPARVVTDYVRDPYERRLMAWMLSTFVFLVVVLLGLPGGSGPGRPVVPIISLAASVVLIVAALVLIVRSVDMGRRALHEQRIMRSVLDTVLDLVDATYPETAPRTPPGAPEVGAGPDEWIDNGGRRTATVKADRIGWVRAIDEARLVDALPPGSVCEIELGIGHLATGSSRLCRVATGETRDYDESEIRAAFELADSRAPETDIGLGVRTLVDIALAGLQDSAADPTTSRQALLHVGAALRPLLIRDGPPLVERYDQDRWLRRGDEPAHVTFVNEALEDLRRVSTDPLTARWVLAVLDDLVDDVIEAGKPERADILRHHARRLLSEVERSGLDEADTSWVRRRARAIDGPVA